MPASPITSTKFNLALALDRFAAIAPWCVYGLGGSILVTKLFPIPTLTTARLLVAWAVIFVVLFVADLLEQKGKWYTPAFADAWADLHNRAGGRIIAGLGPDKPLRVTPSFKLRHIAPKFVLPVLFAVAAYIVPASEPARQTSSAGLERAAKALEKRVDEAAEDALLPAPDAEDIRRQLESVKELAEENPEAAAEALAAVNRNLEAAMLRRLESGAEALEKTLDAAAAWSDREAAGAAGQQAEQAAAEMFKAWNELAKNEGGMENLSPELREAMENALEESGAAGLDEMAANPSQSAGALSQENLDKVLQALAENAAQCSGQAGQSEQSGQPGQSGRENMGQMAQAESGQRGQAGAEGEGEAGQAGDMAGDRIGSLQDALAELSARAAAMTSAEMFGSGGIDQGGGPVPMVFGGETGEAGARFDYQALPEAVSPTPGMKLEDERAALPDEEVPEEFRPLRRSGGAVAERVNAGERVAGLAPARARAAERYFEKLHEGQSNGR